MSPLSPRTRRPTRPATAIRATSRMAVVHPSKILRPRATLRSRCVMPQRQACSNTATLPCAWWSGLDCQSAVRFSSSVCKTQRLVPVARQQVVVEFGFCWVPKTSTLIGRIMRGVLRRLSDRLPDLETVQITDLNTKCICRNRPAAILDDKVHHRITRTYTKSVPEKIGLNDPTERRLENYVKV